MHHPPLPLTRDLVLIGGGHTHALVLRMWGMNSIPGVRLTVINPDPTAAYSGMLPGHVAGHYARDQLQIDLVRLARHAGARLILGRATGIDRVNRQIQVPGRARIGYDIASIDIGITSDMPDLPGFTDHAVPAKPLDQFADRWEAFANDAPETAAVAIIGGGVAGVELALAARHRLGPSAKVSVIEAADSILGLLGRAARQKLADHLTRNNVEVLTGAAAQSVGPGGVTLADGCMVPSDFTLGAAGARPQAWLAETGLDLTDGFVSVGPTLQAKNDPAIFAVGDIAHMQHAPRPKAGVYAVRQAPILLNNLAVVLVGAGRMHRYKPQKDYLKLISTGGKGAVVDRFGLPLDGAWLWRWKDRIDQKFMHKLNVLPDMVPRQAPSRAAMGLTEALGDKPLCGGCGAKMAGPPLHRALAALPPPARDDVLSGPGDDAAVLSHGAGHQVLTTDHLRAFTEDPWTLARITAIHALGDIWAMGAAPQAALAQITLPRMSDDLQSRTMAEIMAAASDVFREAGADIVGGHTSLGAEMTVGFTVTGISKSTPIGQSGAQAGDALILTKPLGTGVILAAEMAKAAPGAVVAGALASMSRLQGNAAEILTPHAHAMTDVTGFGLAGHLMGILEVSGLAAKLTAIPGLPGAQTLAFADQASTLMPANRRAMVDRIEIPDRTATDLLFDPQTAGGLLAAVPGDKADQILAKLQEAGEQATLIGTLHTGTPFITLAL